MKYTNKVSDYNKKVIENVVNESSDQAIALIDWGSAMYRDGFVKGVKLMVIATIIGNSLIYIYKNIKDCRKDANTQNEEP